MKTTIVCVFVLLNIFAAEVTAQINWQTPFTVTSASDILNFGGPIHLAADFNRPETFNPDGDLLFVQGNFDGVINGIQFTGTNEDIPGLLETNFVGFVGSGLSGPNFPPGAANASTFLNGSGGPFYRGVPTDDADLNNLLDSHAFLSTDSFCSVTIDGLTVGDDYFVQLVGIADGRPNSQNATALVDGQVELTRGLYQSVTGRFTANSISETFSVEGNPGLSGIVVQNISSVPEPGSAAVLLAAVTFAACRRRK